MLLRPSVAPARAPQLTLVGALAVVDAVAAETGLAPGIRWPNDVTVAGRKICGVLAEAATTADGRLERVILGIGLNVNQDGFPPEVAARAASLRLLTGRVQDGAAAARDAACRARRALPRVPRRRTAPSTRRGDATA